MPNYKHEYWTPGERISIAKLAGMPIQNLSAILHRRRKISALVARKLFRASGIPIEHWVNNKTTEHPAFFGRPQK